MNASEAEIRVLVIGYGNPLRGDDAVGWFAAQRLAELVDPKHVATMAIHGLTPELAQMISEVDLVIFIDAADHGQPPGALVGKTIDPRDESNSISHHLTPEGLLALSQDLYGRRPHAYLFTAGGADFGHKELLSQPVQEACGLLVNLVREIIDTEPLPTAHH